MKVIHLNYSDFEGGAARAAYRIHQSLLNDGIDSKMWVNKAYLGDWTVLESNDSFQKAMNFVRRKSERVLLKFIKSKYTALNSLSIFPTNWHKLINQSDSDIIHLHWVQDAMLSIGDIGRIKKPIVWTLHDMWAFCGTEHYNDDFRWRQGYSRQNRQVNEFLIDINRCVWNRKRKLWKNTMQIITPSKWLGNCVQESSLMSHLPLNVIPYPINTEKWKPHNKKDSRELLGLPSDIPLLLFGAIGGGNDTRKGFDLLLSALSQIKSDKNTIGFELVVFGQLAPRLKPNLGFPIHFTGHLHDDLSLSILYSAVDAMLIPSRQDNLPNTGIEAHACGTPIVAFNIGGLPDIVEHLKTGYLAKPFDTMDLALGIQWVLEDKGRIKSLGNCAREKAIKLWSENVISKKYIEIYNSII